MASNIQNIGFFSPQTLVAPDLSVEQQQIARSQALAQALREQGMQDIQPNGGAISWTQGLAKGLNAWLGGRIAHQADEKQAALNQAYAARLGSMFGGGPAASAASGADPSAPSSGGGASGPQLAAAVRQAAGIADRGAYGSGGVEDDGSLSPSSSASAPASAGGPAVASSPVAPPQAAPPSIGAMGALSLTGDPRQDMLLYSQNPEEYTKALIAARAPVDLAKTVQQAQAAMQRGDIATASALLANVDKQNYIAPVQMRPGATAGDPRDPSHILAIAPQNIEGATPEIVNGRWTGGYLQAPGAADAIHAAAAAKSIGGAAGDLVQRFNPSTQQMEWVPKTSMLGGGGGPGAPARGPGGGGQLNSMFGGNGGAGGGNAAGAPIGSPQAADQAGKNSANQFTADISAGGASKDRAFSLSKISDLATGLPTGPGAADFSNAKGLANTISGMTGHGPIFNADWISRAQEIDKLASTLAQQQGAALGGQSGLSDARLAAARASLPDVSKAPQAIHDITAFLAGNERAIQGKSAAAAAWQQQHGPGSYTGFAAAWQKNYDPRIYQWMQQGPQAVQRGLRALAPAERQALIAKSNALAAMGALGQ